MQSISVNKAVCRGLVTVYGLFFPFVIGVPALVSILTVPLHLPVFLLLVSVPLGIAAAWVWWSYRVPHWRLWALRHVDDIDTLHQRAVQVGIEWPYGHFFERTEIKSRAHVVQETALQLRYYLQRTYRYIETMDSSIYTRSVLQEIEWILQQLTAEQPISPYHLHGLEQRLQQYLQQSVREIDAASQGTFATTGYLLRKYRRASG